jgi:hypothetical protein
VCTSDSILDTKNSLAVHNLTSLGYALKQIVRFALDCYFFIHLKINWLLVSAYSTDDS